MSYFSEGLKRQNTLSKKISFIFGFILGAAILFIGVVGVIVITWIAWVWFMAQCFNQAVAWGWVR